MPVAAGKCGTWRWSNRWRAGDAAESNAPVLSNATAIGTTDRGITNFLTTVNRTACQSIGKANGGRSTGPLVEPLDAHKQSLYRLRRYQRAVARRIECPKVAASIPKDKPFPNNMPFACSCDTRHADDANPERNMH